MRMLDRAAAILAALALTGCGSANRVQVQGVLLKGGAPFTPPEGASNEVVFVAMDVRDDSGKSVGPNEPFPALFDDADATFESPRPGWPRDPSG